MVCLEFTSEISDIKYKNKKLCNLNELNQNFCKKIVYSSYFLRVLN